MSDDWVLGIDLGTTYFKLGLFDRQGRLGGLGRVAVPTDAGEDGNRCELPVARFEALMRAAWMDACRAAGLDPASLDLQGMAYASQANSFVLLDAGDQALTPLILWPDRRAEAPAATIAAYNRRPDRVPQTGMGLPLEPAFAINKLDWCCREAPDVWQRTRYVMTISDYLVFRLTGHRAGDLGTAGLLGVVDPRAGDWWPAALHDLQLDRRMLTPLYPPGTLVGPTRDSATAAFGLPADVPVALGSLDHHMAATGLGVPWHAPVAVSLGTVLACLAVLPDYQPFQNGCCGRGFAGQGYTRLTFCENGGGKLERFWKQHAADHTLADLDAAAARIPFGCEGLRALPDASVGTDLSGFVGSDARHTPAHYFRALMESSADSLNALLQALGAPPALMLSGGGAHSAPWREIIRQITGCQIMTSACPEPACRGAAMAAAIAAGWFHAIDEAVAAWTP